MTKVQTLCIIQRPGEILLGMKKRGFGAGRWNGFGGNVLPGETVEEAAKRELNEEANITVDSIEKVAIIEFEFKGSPEVLQVHLFKSEEFSGEPMESDEMKPEWFRVDRIPFNDMWPDDQYWIPLFLSRKKFTGKILFQDSNTILKQEWIEVETI